MWPPGLCCWEGWWLLTGAASQWLELTALLSIHSVLSGHSELFHDSFSQNKVLLACLAQGKRLVSVQPRIILWFRGGRW